jgi:hypothetical protein
MTEKKSFIKMIRNNDFIKSEMTEGKSNEVRQKNNIGWIGLFLKEMKKSKE